MIYRYSMIQRGTGGENQQVKRRCGPRNSQPPLVGVAMVDTSLKLSFSIEGRHAGKPNVRKPITIDDILGERWRMVQTNDKQRDVEIE